MSTPVTSLSNAELQKAAREHLWLHFTRMSSYRDAEIPVQEPTPIRRKNRHGVMRMQRFLMTGNNSEVTHPWVSL